MKVEVNPEREILFFAHDSSPIVYVFMSLELSKKAFHQMFPAAVQITEDQADDFILKQNYEVVYVGDNDVIDEYFNTNEIKKANAKAEKRYHAEKK